MSIPVYHEGGRGEAAGKRQQTINEVGWRKGRWPAKKYRAIEDLGKKD